MKKLLILPLLFSLIGCSSGSPTPDPGNLYLTQCFINGDGEVEVFVDLPEEHEALLFIEGNETADFIVVLSGPIVYGVLPAGEQTIVLRLRRSTTQDIPGAFNTRRRIVDLTGVEERCTVVSPGPRVELLPPPPPAPEPNPVEPTLTCNINTAGAVTLIVNFHDYEGPCILRRVGDEENDSVLFGDETFLDLPLDPGEYEFQLLIDDRVVAKCIIGIPEPPEPPAPEVCERYLACSVRGVESPPKYGMRLDGFFSGECGEVVLFGFKKILFDILCDGTARLHGKVNLLDPLYGGEDEIEYPMHWKLDILMEPAGAQFVDEGDNFDFYTIVSGTLMAGDHVASLVGYGDPFQVGYGANNKTENFGAAGWLNYQHGEYGDLDEHCSASDLLMDLKSADNDYVVCYDGQTVLCDSWSSLCEYLDLGAEFGPCQEHN